jgi:precorrin-6x reductase
VSRPIKAILDARHVFGVLLTFNAFSVAESEKTPYLCNVKKIKTHYRITGATRECSI